MHASMHVVAYNSIIQMRIMEFNSKHNSVVDKDVRLINKHDVTWPERTVIRHLILDKFMTTAERNAAHEKWEVPI